MQGTGADASPATTATGSPTSPRSTRTSAPTPSSRRSSTRRTPAASRSSSTSSPTTPPTSSTTRRASTPTSTRRPSPTATPPATAFDDRDYAGRRHLPGARRRRRRSRTRRSSAPRPTRPSRCRPGSTTRRYYHNRGDSTFAGETSTYGDFFGLDDLFTEQPEVVDGHDRHLQDAGSTSASTASGSTPSSTSTWSSGSSSRRRSAARGRRRRQRRLLHVRRGLRRRPGVHVDATPPRAASTPRSTSASRARGVGFAKGRPTTGLRDFFAGDDYYTDTDSNAYALPTFLGNHDMGRIGVVPRPAASTATSCCDRDELAHALMYLTRGQPVVYYGDEQGFTGDGGDKDARQDMFASQVAVVQRRRPDRHRRHDGEDQLRHRAPAVPHDRRRWPTLRERHPALADGAQMHRYATDGAGVYAFSRIGAGREPRVRRRGQQRDHRARRRRFATLHGATARSGRCGRPSRARCASDDEGRVDVTVPPLSRGRASRAAGTARRRARTRRRCYFGTPQRRRRRRRRAAEVGVAVPDGGFNQVTFACAAGRARRLDRARHRRQRAVPRVPRRLRPAAGHAARVPRGAAEDSSGNLSVASTYATVGDPAAGGGGGTPAVGRSPSPTNVSHARLAQQRDGCPGDWLPDCDQAQLTLDPTDQVWKGTVTLPGRRLRVQGRDRQAAGTRTTAPAARQRRPTSRSTPPPAGP